MRRRSDLTVVALLAVLGGCGQVPELVRYEPSPRALGEYEFVVIGDSRPGERLDGNDPASVSKHYVELIQSINRVDPDFIINVGDLILGYNTDTPGLAERQWDAYEKATSRLNAPNYPVAGNHDIWDEFSAGVYSRRCCDLHYSFDRGGCHFSALCSEVPGETGAIGPEQLAWLDKDLAGAQDAKHRFVFLHRPLWSRNGRYSEETIEKWMAEVHPLLKKHNVGTVFAGHDHFYEFERIDGIRYIITGGGGAELRRPPETGGFYHFLRVRVPEEGPPRITVVEGGDEHAEDVVRADVIRIAGRMQDDLVVDYTSEETAKVTLVVTNTLAEEVALSLGWVADADVTVAPTDATFVLQPGQERELAFGLDVTEAGLVRPELAWAMVGGGKALASGRFAPAISRRGRYAREGAPAPPVLAVTVPSQVVIGVDRWTGPSDCSAECVVVRADEGFTVAVTVADETLDTANTHLWECDSVELYLDLRPEPDRGSKKYGRGVFQMIVTPEEGRTATFPKGSDVPGAKVTTATVDGGYRVSVFLPFAGLEEKHFLPGPDGRLNFALGLNDADGAGSRESQLMWSGTPGNWGNASAFGRMRPAVE
jgi:3',5'-cyclic AMP phosphodiesterase CpdA